VRNQLSVVRNGGSAGVRISSRDEASQVLLAIETGSADAALSGGLRSLRSVLAAGGVGEHA